MRSSSGCAINLMHITPPVKAEGYDGSHHRGVPNGLRCVCTQDPTVALPDYV